MDTLTSLGFASQKEEIRSGLAEAAVGCVTITKVPLALTFYDPMNNPGGKLLVQLVFSNTSWVGTLGSTRYTGVIETKIVPFSEYTVQWGRYK